MFFTACSKKSQNTNNNPVPSVPVNITVYPNDPFYAKIQNIGGWMYIAGGINGIVLYRKSNEEFVALERTSSQLPDDPRAAVVVQKNNFTVKDTISGSEWQMIDAVVSKGPATWPLRIYGTTYDGNILAIRN